MAPMELYLLRHAHAGDPAKWQGADTDRPLSARGRAQCERLAAFLERIGFRPDAVVSSPKMRALETARLATGSLGVEVTIDDRLGYGFDLEALVDLARDCGNPARLVVVGHDPDFSDLLAELTGAPRSRCARALARVDLDPHLRPGPGPYAGSSTGAPRAQTLPVGVAADQAGDDGRCDGATAAPARRTDGSAA
jgi:phosphohistidine phosphatase